MLGRSEAIIQISQSYRGILIKVNAYQALVWSSTLLSFQKHCFNLTNAALPFVTLTGDCVVKRSSAQATCCRSSTNCLQMSSPWMSPSRPRLKQHLKFASHKCSGQAAWQNRVESQTLLLSALQEPIAVAGRAWQAAGYWLHNLGLDGKSWKFPQPRDTECSFPYHSPKQVDMQSCLQGTKVDQGRDTASCPSQGWKLWCFAPPESTHQRCQLKNLPKQLNLAEAWRNPWNKQYYRLWFAWQRKYTSLYSQFSWDFLGWKPTLTAPQPS